jgi:hypothetical protein
MIRKDCKGLSLKARHSSLPNVSCGDRLSPGGFGSGLFGRGQASRLLDEVIFSSLYYRANAGSFNLPTQG